MVFDIDISSQFKKTERPFHYDFKNADFESLRTSLFLLPLCNGIHQIKDQEEFDCLWEQWSDFVFASVNTFIPKVNCLNKSRPPWIKGELVKAIKKKKIMWRRLKNSSATPARLEKFRKFRQHVKNWTVLRGRSISRKLQMKFLQMRNVSGPICP